MPLAGHHTDNVGRMYVYTKATLAINTYLSTSVYMTLHDTHTDCFAFVSMKNVISNFTVKGNRGKCFLRISEYKCEVCYWSKFR